MKKEFKKPKRLTKFKYDDLPDYIQHMCNNHAICIIPLKAGTKVPIRNVKWTNYRGLHKQYPLKSLKRKKGNFAIICGDPMQGEVGHLVVLDIDDKKGETGLYRIFKDIETLQVKTPSKGFHIYFWSENPVEDKDYIGKLFGLDIELRGNPGCLTTLPKSCITDEEGNVSGHQIVKENIIIDVTNIEEFVKDRLVKAGYEIKSPEINPIITTDYILPSIDGKWSRSLNDEEIEKLVNLLEPFYKEGQRQNMCLWLSGWMQKAEIDYKSAEKVIQRIAKKDKEIKQRLTALKNSYRGLEEQNNKGSSGIYELILSHFKTAHFNVEDIDKRSGLIKRDTHDSFHGIKNIIVHELSILGVKDSLMALRDGEQGLKKQIKHISRFLRNRFQIVKDKVTGEHWIYNHEHGIYEHYTFDRFLEFLSLTFDDELFTMTEAKMLKSMFSYTKEESNSYISFKDCLLDIKSLETEDFDPEEFVTFQVPYKWNPEAKGGFVEEKLREILIDKEGDYAEDESKFIQFMQMVGYCFEKGNPRQKMFIFIGGPGSGKTQLVLLIGGLFSNGISAVPLQQFKERFGLQPLLNKRINVLYDISKKEIEDPSIIKAVTGNDPITIDRKNKEPITLENGLPIKTIGAGNELPKLVDESNAMYQRIITIEVNNKFRGSEDQIEDLAEELLKDTEGIEWLIYESIRLYKEMKDNNKKFILEVNSEETKKKYLKIADPCRYIAEELFYKSNDENDFYSNEEIISLMSDFLKAENLRIPSQNSEFYSAIREIGGEKTQRRINGDPRWGFTLISTKKYGNNPIKYRLDKETKIRLFINKDIDYAELTHNESRIINQLKKHSDYTVKKLINDIKPEFEIDKREILSILKSWQRKGWLQIDNSIYLSQMECNSCNSDVTDKLLH